MMYRAGYSYKDSNQERILALKMKHEDFTRFLERAVLATENPVDPKSETAHEGRTGGANKTQAQDGDVKVQWDPERSVRLGRLDFRSIQIGVRGATRTQWIEDWIVSIEDVTEKAKALKAILDELPDISEQELLDRDVLPRETPFEVSEPLQQVLGMC